MARPRLPRRAAASPGVARHGLRSAARPRDARLTAGVGTGAMTENSLDLFLRSARQHPLLTADEEIELAKRIERGDLEPPRSG